MILNNSKAEPLAVRKETARLMLEQIAAEQENAYKGTLNEHETAILKAALYLTEEQLIRMVRYLTNMIIFDNPPIKKVRADV